MKIRKLLWSDHCFNFRFQLTPLVGNFVIVLRFGFGFQILCNEGLQLILNFLMESCFCFRCVLLLYLNAVSSSSTQTGSTTGKPGSVWDGCYKWYQSLVSCCCVGDSSLLLEE